MHKIALLDMRLLNTDRNDSNILVRDMLVRDAAAHRTPSLASCSSSSSESRRSCGVPALAPGETECAAADAPLSAASQIPRHVASSASIRNSLCCQMQVASAHGIASLWNRCAGKSICTKAERWWAASPPAQGA